MKVGTLIAPERLNKRAGNPETREKTNFTENVLQTKSAQHNLFSRFSRVQEYSKNIFLLRYQNAENPEVTALPKPLFRADVLRATTLFYSRNRTQTLNRPLR